MKLVKDKKKTQGKEKKTNELKILRNISRANSGENKEKKDKYWQQQKNKQRREFENNGNIKKISQNIKLEKQKP